MGKSLYAKETIIEPEQTRNDIEKLLFRYGADTFGYGRMGTTSIISFRFHSLVIKLTVEEPLLESFFKDSSDRKRSPEKQKLAWKQAIRSRWRLLLLVIKGRLEMITVGMSSFEEQFMADIVMPNEQRLSDWVRPILEEANRTDRMPMLTSGD